VTTDGWQRVEQLCHSALERDPSERDEFLRKACAGDDALRHEVESLLANARDASRVLPGTVSLVGRQIGGYHVLSLLGAGGMGEVYRARDATLGRDVALKVLPGIFLSDAERLARFEREARLLAALNHPHIGAIYGVEDADGVRALVLELVEGETLADRIQRGPIPVRDALAIGRQIVDALDAAHDRGIIHRDLKPANIKITPEGVVKVLDFGLAKALALEPAFAAGPAHPANVTIGGTREGAVLGTPAFMSPEQARGQVLDKRADIWALGCVLYEMLTGRQAFAGETASDIVAAILDREPDWSKLPPATPPSVRSLLQKCLAKDRHLRLADIADARFDLGEPLGTEGQRAGHRPRLAIMIAAIAVITAAGAAAPFLFGTGDRGPAALQFEFTPPPGSVWAPTINIPPALPANIVLAV
jgi:serine/threonine protein kinase